MFSHCKAKHKEMFPLDIFNAKCIFIYLFFYRYLNRRIEPVYQFALFLLIIAHKKYPPHKFVIY